MYSELQSIIKSSEWVCYSCCIMDPVQHTAGTSASSHVMQPAADNLERHAQPQWTNKS
jgi:hypothetical protein